LISSSDVWIIIQDIDLEKQLKKQDLISGFLIIHR